MAKIKVLNEGIEVEVPDGAAIKEYVKKESGMLFGCEQGDCGTCVCSIAKGSENINKKTQEIQLEALLLVSSLPKLLQRIKRKWI